MHITWKPLYSRFSEHHLSFLNIFIIFLQAAQQAAKGESHFSLNPSHIFTVKPGQAYPQDSIWKLVVAENQYQMKNCISVCIMSNKFFAITPLYSVRLKYLWMDKTALKTFASNSRKLRCQFTAYWNLQLPMDSSFEL